MTPTPHNVIDDCMQLVQTIASVRIKYITLAQFGEMVLAAGPDHCTCARQTYVIS
jgi:hypothetical protein